MTQRWKTDESLYGCKRTKNGKKILDYYGTYVDEFLESDPIRDWESFERCKNLWNWAIKKIDETSIKSWKVLDCGTKDGQFPEWLGSKVEKAVGIEISKEYVNYASSKNRPVILADVCDIPYDDDFDFVFSHHLHGLTPDYRKALDEMWRVTKPGGYMLVLNDVPGNKRKHYSYIANDDIYKKFVSDNMINIDKILWMDHWSEEYPKEYVMFLKRRNNENR